MTETYKKVVQWGADAYGWVVIEVPNIINNIITFFKELPGKIWEWMVNTYDKLVQWGVDAKEWVTNKVSEIATAFVEFFTVTIPEKFTAFINWIKELPTRLYEFGKDIIQGMLNGILSIASNLGSWVKDNIFSPFMDGFNNAFQRNSPSKVMEDGGLDIMGGLDIGLINGQSGVLATVASSATNIIGKFKDMTGGVLKNAVAFGKDLVKDGKSTLDTLANNTKSLLPTTAKQFASSFSDIGKSSGAFSKDLTKTTNESMESMRRSVQSASTPLINLFKTLYTNIKNEATLASTAVINSTNTMMNTMRTTILNATAPIASAFKAMCAEITTAMNNMSSSVTSAASAMVSGMASAVSNSSSAFTNAIKSMMNTAIGHVETAMNRMISGVNSGVKQMATALNSVPGTTITTSSGNSISIPRLNVGHPYIPYDNYLAYLHEGERVLTREENRDYSHMDNSKTHALLDRLIGAVEDMTGRPIEVGANVYLDGRRLDSELDRVRIEKGTNIFPGGLAFGLE